MNFAKGSLSPKRSCGDLINFSLVCVYRLKVKKKKKTCINPSTHFHISTVCGSELAAFWRCGELNCQKKLHVTEVLLIKLVYKAAGC